MIEDKLNRFERIRLECLAQAIAKTMGRGASSEVIIREAQAFEKYVLNGVQDDQR